MREPDFEVDGWREAREALQPGDLAKLIFRISVDNPDEPIAVERMWVIVRERTVSGYLGVLDNDPDAIAKNDEFWSGTELPFGPHHIINIDERDEKTIRLAVQEPKRRWPRA